jgi:hypothetical protein
MGKSFAQAMFEAQAQTLGMSRREAERVVTTYMEEQHNMKVEREQEEDSE